MNINRRNFIQALSAWIVLFHPRSLIALDESTEIKQNIISNKESAMELIKEAVDMASDITDYTAANFAKRETVLRWDLYRQLIPIPTKELNLYVLSEREELASEFHKEDILLLPNEDEIKVQVGFRKGTSEKCDESILSVTVDIFLEALGLREIKEAIIKAISNSPEIRDKIDELAKTVQFRDWEQAINFVAAIMDLMSSAGMADILIKLMGPKEGRKIWRRILKQLGARFVPFVGQVYTVIAIGVALFNNKQRLLQVINCNIQ